MRRFKKKQIDLDSFEDEFEIDECPALHFDHEDIQKMSYDECMEWAVEIRSFAMMIQKAINRQTAYRTWLEAKITLAIANDLQNYEGYYSFDQRRSVAIVNNEYAKQLEEMRINVQMKLDMLHSYPFQINQISTALLEKRRP